MYNFVVTYSKSDLSLFVLVDDDDDGDGILDKDEVDGAYHMILFLINELHFLKQLTMGLIFFHEFLLFMVQLFRKLKQSAKPTSRKSGF